MARTNATNRTTSTARVADGYRLNRQEHSPSASFNGSSTGITLGFKVNPTGFTVLAWVKIRKSTNNDRIFDQQDAGPSNGFALVTPVGAADRSTYFSVYGASSEEANLKMAMNLWEWTHIAISFETNSAKLYKNGILKGTDTAVTLGGSTTNLTVGKRATSAANFFNGLMRDLVIYDSVLTQEQIRNVRNGVYPTANLKCHLPLYSDLLDISGNGNDGIGTVAFTYTNDSPFNDTECFDMYAPLKSSLLLSRGVGYPSWSRATKAWGFNELGYLEELASGCAFFGGARLVRNLLAATEDSSSGSWVKSTGTTAAQATDSGGGSTAMRFTYGSNQSYLMRQIPTVTSRDAMYCAQFRFKTDATHDWWRLMIFDGGVNQCRVWFNAQTGTIGNTVPSGSGVFVSATLTDVGGGWFALRLVGSPGVAGTGVVYAQFSANDGDGSTAISSAASGDAITIEKPSLVDVTNYDASYVPEYVSVGVVASPFFGAGIDGAKYFETDWQGAPLSAASLLGFRREAAATNNLLHSRDLSNAAWSTKTNITAAKTATGLDGIANTATTLTATAADAIILQPITLASAARCASAYVKRRTGTGTISFTQDGGSTWTDITALINGSTWSRVEITATLANPSTGFKISTSGDAIDVDVVQNESGTSSTSPIITTTAAVTRNAEVLTYQLDGNINIYYGTLVGTILSRAVGLLRYLINIGDSYSYISSAQSNTEWRLGDGTSTVSITGLDNIANGNAKRACAWGNGVMKVTGNGKVPAAASFDGTFGSTTTLTVGLNLNGNVKDVKVYGRTMTDEELQNITT